MFESKPEEPMARRPSRGMSQSSKIADLASKINMAALGGGGGDPYSNPNHPLYKAKAARESNATAEQMPTVWE